MAKIPDNYLGPKHRITMLKGDHPGTKSAIKTSVTLQPMGAETLCVLVKASIEVDGQIVAEGHAFTDTPDEDKAVEKTETIAIGRALVNAGYPELSEDLEESDGPATKAESKKTPGKGLGAVGKKPVKVEDDAAEAEEKPPTKVAVGLGNRLGTTKPTAAKKPETVEEAASEGDSGTVEAEVVDDPPATKKMTREELLAKYKKK